MNSPLRILILEDSSTDAELLQRVLIKEKWDAAFRVAANKADFVKQLSEFKPHVVLSDNSLPQFNAEEALKIVRQELKQVPFILVTGTVSDEFAANIIKSGADDYIMKDRLVRLPVAIEAALRQRQAEKEMNEAAESLRMSEESYRNMMARVSDAFVSLDKDWRYTYMNKQAGELMRREPAELIGKKIWDIFPDAGTSTYRAFHQAMEEQRFMTIIDYYAPLDLWFESNIYPSENGLSVFVRDISERKKSEREISERENKYRTLVEQAFDAIITYSPDGNIIECNETACLYSGYTSGELKGLSVIKLFFASDLVNYPIDWEKLRSGHSTLDYRRIKRKDGQYIEMEISTKRMPDGNLMAIARDITERKKAQEALQKSEEKYRTIFLKSPLPNWIFDVETLRFLDVNEAAIKHYGYTREEFLEMTIKDIRPKSDEERLMDDIQKIQEGFDSRRGQWTHLKKDGTIIIVETTAHSIEYGGHKARLVIANDVTEKLKVQQELQESETRLRQAQETAHLGNWEIDLASDRSKWSDEAYRIYGLAPGEHQFSFEQWMSFIHPEDAPKVAKAVKTANETLTDFAFDHRILRRDGVIRHVYTEGKFEFDAAGKPTGLYGIVHDITERKEAEEEVQKSNERFQYATKASSDIIWELNFETKKYLLHEGKQKLFGVDTTLTWETGVEGTYIVPEDRELVRASFGEARMDPERTLWEMEYRLQGADGAVIHIVNHAIFIRDKKGRVMRAIGALTDITERKRLEENLLEQQRMEQAKIMATALEAQEKERTAIGIELHDNVNQIIVGTILLLSMAKNQPEKAGETIKSAIDNLQEAIRENRKIAHVFVAPDLESESLTDQLKTLARNMLETPGIKLKMLASRFDESLLDPERKINIYRIAQEQCSNIVKYANATEVAMKLSTTKNQFKMVISDNGIGMDSDKKVTGIGLRNIRGRLSIFNGTAKIVTAPGKGFALEILIPLGEVLRH